MRAHHVFLPRLCLCKFGYHVDNFVIYRCQTQDHYCRNGSRGNNRFIFGYEIFQLTCAPYLGIQKCADKYKSKDMCITNTYSQLKAGIVGIGSWLRACKQYNKVYSLLLTARSFKLWLDMQLSPPASSQGFAALWLLSCQPWSYNSSEHLGLTWVSVESKRK